MSREAVYLVPMGGFYSWSHNNIVGIQQLYRVGMNFFVYRKTLGSSHAPIRTQIWLEEGQIPLHCRCVYARSP